MDGRKKKQVYEETLERIQAVIAQESELIAGLSTVVCELHHAFDYYDWTGFYRVTQERLLKVGPYQGGHGCLQIPFGRGVCGKAAATKSTQLHENVNEVEDHIACSSSTQSEIVVPILDENGNTLAVFDVDSNNLAAFDQVDATYLEACRLSFQAFVLGLEFFSRLAFFVKRR